METGEETKNAGNGRFHGAGEGDFGLEANTSRDDYITLYKATRYCSYSQDYLNLLVRQKKLKAMKIGRNWVTTIAWLSEYLKRVEDWNKYGFKKKELANIPPLDETAIVSAPFSAVPAASFSVAPKKEALGLYQAERRGNVYFLFGAFLFLLFFGFGIGNEAFRAVLADISGAERHAGVASREPAAVKTNTDEAVCEESSADRSASGAVARFAALYASLHATPELADGNVFAILGDLERDAKKIMFFDEFRSYFLWLAAELGNKLNAFGLVFLPAEERARKTSKESGGMVIAPSGENDAKLKETIRQSFSDEVIVEIEDEDSGYIVPQFKSGPGGKYFYVLVPVDNLDEKK